MAFVLHQQRVDTRKLRHGVASEHRRVPFGMTHDLRIACVEHELAKAPHTGPLERVHAPPRYCGATVEECAQLATTLCRMMFDNEQSAARGAR